MDNVILYSKLASLPEHMKAEVSAFIDSLLKKEMKGEENAAILKPKFGSAKGMFKMHEDFDEPLEDFKEYMN